LGRLEGKVAIVTGAASGIGRAMAVAIASEGADVVIADVNDEGLEETKHKAGKASVVVHRTDVANPDEVERLVSTAVQKFGKLTTICNNAGVSKPGTVLEATKEEFERTIAVNLGGVFYGCKYAIPAMLDAGGGSIVNTGSVNSLMAERRLAAYCASKGAVLMLTKSVAMDFAAKGIRCNCICPGFVDTPLNIPHYNLLGGIDKVRESLPEWVPMGRGGEPEEIAAAAVFLASDDSSYVTGTAFVVDGGISTGI
jgi:meso-butanediol dehydrogenase / (S,S)-butanediol dehydrogenase / diacetyl reductase